MANILDRLFFVVFGNRGFKIGIIVIIVLIGTIVSFATSGISYKEEQIKSFIASAEYSFDVSNCAVTREKIYCNKDK